MEKILIHNQFRDYDEFAHIIQKWDLDFLQLDIGKFNTSMLQLSSIDSLYTHAHFNRCFEQHGSAPPGLWTFGILSHGSTPISWRKKQPTKKSIIVYTPGSEIDCVSKPDFEVFSISYSEAHLNRLGADLGLPEIRNLCKNSDAYEISQPKLTHIQQELFYFDNTLGAGYLPSKDQAVRYFLDIELPEKILLALSDSKPLTKIPLGMRERTIRKTKEYIDAFPDERIAINTLCRLAGVSERTLQYAFQEYYGVTPKTYLKSYQLNCVRRKILEIKSKSAPISDIANDFGFWHMGQFAADYRKLFRELPSETLRRNES